MGRVSTLRTACIILVAFVAAAGQQVLYNGIVLPETWPPRDVVLTNEVIPEPPYLAHPPAVIPIDVGRQLFVDDFLIEKTDLRREYHRPEFYSGNPVLKAVGSVFYDPHARYFKAWRGGRDGTVCMTSRDGVHWEEPEAEANPEGTTPRGGGPNLVWIDSDDKDPQRRYKGGRSMGHARPYVLFVSADGVHWGQPIAVSVPTGDATTYFRNPFRNVWVASVRDHDWTPPTGAATNWVISEDPPDPYQNYIGRLRRYWESPVFESMVGYKSDPDLASNPRRAWGLTSALLWVMADRLDPRRSDLNVRPQLYNLDAVAYESVMLGILTIWPGQFRNSEKAKYLTVGYSRDGFHWSRPDRRAFLAPTERFGDWNFANMQSVGGVCLIVGDRLYFYVTGRTGVAGKRASGTIATGLATMRRDGFASMDADGDLRSLTTRPVRFSGKRLYVNVDSAAGDLRVEVLDADNRVLKNLSAEDCIPLRTDNTLAEVRWRGTSDLSGVSGRPVRFRFLLRNARLFAFWVSPNERGSSNGYVAAGGPGFTGSRDTEGKGAYQSCCRPVTW